MADQSERTMRQHMDECSRKMDSLREMITEKMSELEKSSLQRHSENSRRLDVQDNQLSRQSNLMLSLILSVAGTLIITLGGLVFQLIHNGGRL